MFMVRFNYCFTSACKKRCKYLTLFTLFFIVSTSPSNCFFEEIPVVALFGTGTYDEKTFDGLKMYVEKSSKTLPIIPIMLGTGSQEEELSNLHHLIDKLEKSILKNDLLNKKIEQSKKTDDKLNIAMVACSLSGVYARCLLQKRAPYLPFVVKKFISICAPQAGLYNLPPVKTFENPIEKKCADVQKLMTEKLLPSLTGSSSNSDTETTNTPSPSSSTTPTSSSSFSWFRSFVLSAASYFNLDKTMAYKTLYTETSQKKYSAANVWRDPFHYEEYLKFNNFLPLYNKEIESEANKDFVNNLNITSSFHFIASYDDLFIPKETATLCECITSEEKLYIPAFTSSEAPKKGLGTRLFGSNQHGKKVTFDVIKNSGHRCVSDQGIIQKAGNYLLELEHESKI